MANLFDHEKINNALIKALQKPAFLDEVKQIALRNATLLVPENNTLEGIEITPAFIETHIVLINSSSPDEFVSLNGVLGVFRTVRGTLTISTLPQQVQVGPKDKQNFFDSTRSMFLSFKRDERAKQSVTVLRDGDVLLAKHLVKIFLISEPLACEGATWGRNSVLIPNRSVSSPSLLAPSSPKKESPSDSKLQNLFGEFGKLASKALGKDSSSMPTSQTSSTAARPPQSPAERQKMLKELFFTKAKQAPEILKRIREFTAGFSKKPPVPEDQGKIVRNIIDELLHMAGQHKLWRGASEDEMEMANEAIEKYLMTKIFNCCFSPSVDDLERDKAIFRTFASLQFITPTHLDINERHHDEEKFQQAIEEIRKINAYKAPRDKLVCILNACKIIYSILNKASSEGHAAGADEFLPLLIYVVLKSNPPQMHSNIQYILRFRNPSKMITEAGYYFTHVESAIDFIENVNPSKLTIDPAEFERLKTEFEATLPPRGASTRTLSPSDTPMVLSPSVVRDGSLLGSGDDSDFYASSTTGAGAGTQLPAIADLMGFDPTSIIITNEQGHSAGSPVGSLQRSGSALRVSLPPSSDRSLGTTSGHSSRSMSMMFDEPSEFGADDLTRFARTSIEDLKVADVASLLYAYKRLVQENEKLTAEVALLRSTR